MRRLVFVTIIGFSTPANAAPSEINAVIGDASWVATHDRKPSSSDSEDDRIRTHRELKDGSYEPFLLIDADTRVSVSIVVKDPKIPRKRNKHSTPEPGYAF